MGGIAGPVAFIVSWLVLGSRLSGYSPVQDTISRLAASGAPTRPAMTAGIVAFSAGAGLFALRLRGSLGSPAWRTLLAGGLATLGVAAFPLGTPANDAAHAACVALAYPALAATPALAARSLRQRGRLNWARASWAAAVGSGLFLASSVLGPFNGLFQRVGLGLVDMWIMAMAADDLRRPAEAPSSPLPHGTGA